MRKLEFLVVVVAANARYWSEVGLKLAAAATTKVAARKTLTAIMRSSSPIA